MTFDDLEAWLTESVDEYDTKRYIEIGYTDEGEAEIDAKVRGLAGTELAKALKATRGCGCCVSGEGDAIRHVVLDEVARRLQRDTSQREHLHGRLRPDNVIGHFYCRDCGASGEYSRVIGHDCPGSPE